METLFHLSLGLRILALLGALALMARVRSWGSVFLAGAIALAVFRLVQRWDLKPPQAESWTILGVSSLCFFGVLVAARTLEAHKRSTDRVREEGEARFRRIVDSAQEGIWSIDAEGRTTFANARLAEMLGHEPQEMIGLPVLHFIGDIHTSRARKRLDERFEGSGSQVTCLRHKDGESVWARLSINPLYSSAGSYDGALAMVTDITEQRRLEIRARGRSRVLEEFVRGASLGELLNTLCLAVEEGLPGHRCGVLLLDEDERVLRFRAGPSLPPSLRRIDVPLGPLSGASGSAAFHRRPFHIDDSASHPASREYRELALENGICSSWSVPIQSASGDRVLGTLTCYSRRPGLPSTEDEQFLLNHAGQAFVAIEQRRTLDELEQTRGQLVAAIEQSPAGIVIAEAPSGRVRVANAKALGLTPGAPLNLDQVPMEQLPIGWTSCHMDGTPMAIEELPLHKALHQGHTSRNVEVLLRREDGMKRWVLASASPVLDAEGRVRAGVAVFFDITARKRDERDLQGILKSLGAKTEELEQLFRTTTHDLRAPLVNVEGFARELELGLDDLERLVARTDMDRKSRSDVLEVIRGELRFSLGHVQSSAARMEQLMKGMARLNAVDRHELALGPVDMGALMEEVVGAFEYRVRAEDVQVELGPLPSCLGDPTQLGQVFTNLIDNAIKYRKPDRPARVRVFGRRETGRVIYTVQDDGIGIPADQLDLIFRPFHRMNNGPEGEGLGLAILRRIMSRLNGRVRALSELGQGSRFEVELPTADRAVDAKAGVGADRPVDRASTPAR